ncbi:MAG: hypothetical protein J4203_03520 [Candidatus Diapherotrites archaeon]|uniref:Carbamoyltransferase n=1 Tax=Candidatus Iainarchaeum sp. TaxID=3101447 RepID=A0A8T4L8A3_9ARCH|nr:hypothetical protein [Candidatus Diapherotrites archaeon]
MNVLGIDASHNTAALVKDGRLVASAEEERFDRCKHSRNPPVHAIRFCLEYAGLAAADVDYVAVGMDEVDHYAGLGLILSKVLFDGYPPGLLRKRFSVLRHHLFTDPARLRTHSPLSSAYWGKKVDAATDGTGLSAEIRVIPHHVAHGAWASLPTGWKNASCLVADGAGDWESTTAYAYHDQSIEFLRKETYANSLGFLYFNATDYLGFGFLQEGKTMGLAAYGDPQDVPGAVLDQIVRVPGELSPWYTVDSRILTDYYYGRGYLSHFTRLFGAPKRPPGLEATTPPYPVAAAAVQRSLEKALLHTVKKVVESTGEKKLCLGGGVAMNCSANGKIWASGLVDELAVQVAPMDSGTAAGAALRLAQQLGEKPLVEPDRSDWGPEFSDAEIEKALEAAGLRFERCPGSSIAGKAADLVAKGKIVGWFQGRMELGARALGHRSILANPGIKGMNDRVNRVKHRELWRPFAPSIAAERLGEYVQKPCPSPFMLIAFHANPNGKRELPTVIHVDGTTRVQTVDKRLEPLYYRLLREVEGHTSHPAVLNTSFNDAGEPIVCSPRDAIRSYFGMGLDALAIGNYLALNPEPGAKR